MKNLVSDLSIAPISYKHSAAVSSGDAIRVGAILLVAINSYAANELGAYRPYGSVELPAKSTDTFDEGQSINWDDSEAELTEASGADGIGVAVTLQAKASGVDKVRVLLTP